MKKYILLLIAVGMQCPYSAHSKHHNKHRIAQKAKRDLKYKKAELAEQKAKVEIMDKQIKDIANQTLSGRAKALWGNKAFRYTVYALGAAAVATILYQLGAPQYAQQAIVNAYQTIPQGWYNTAWGSAKGGMGTALTTAKDLMISGKDLASSYATKIADHGGNAINWASPYVTKIWDLGGQGINKIVDTTAPHVQNLLGNVKNLGTSIYNNPGVFTAGMTANSATAGAASAFKNHQAKKAEEKYLKDNEIFGSLNLRPTNEFSPSPVEDLLNLNGPDNNYIVTSEDPIINRYKQSGDYKIFSPDQNGIESKQNYPDLTNLNDDDNKKEANSFMQLDKENQINEQLNSDEDNSDEDNSDEDNSDEDNSDGYNSDEDNNSEISAEAADDNEQDKTSVASNDKKLSWFGKMKNWFTKK